MRRKLFILVIISGLFFVSVGTVSGAQYGITVGATVEVSNQVAVYIPVGTYHVYISVDADVGMSGTADCVSSILSVAIQDPLTNPYVFESVVTVNQSADYVFIVNVNALTGFGYYANFAIVLTDLDVALLTKTSVIGNAPFNLEFIILGILCISVGLSIMRRKQNKN